MMKVSTVSEDKVVASQAKFEHASQFEDDFANLDTCSDCSCDVSSSGSHDDLFAEVISGDFSQTSLQTIVNNHEALIRFVINVMVHHGWRDVEQSHVILKSCSGFEGKTFEVRIDGQSSSLDAVALHILQPHVAVDEISKGRRAAAQKLFSEHSLAPRCLAKGCDWFIDPWSGSTIGRVYELNRPGGVAAATPEELGELLAKIHEMPTDWFDEWREQLCNRTPALRSADFNSHIWPFTAMQLVKDFPPDALSLWCSVGPKPTSFAGARAVTSHSDFHPANIVRTQNGLQVIDFGFTCVTCAAKDLAWACEYYLHGRAEKRAFASAYLKACGLPASFEDVDDLCLDAERFALHSFGGVLHGQLNNLKHDLQHGLDEYFPFAAIAEDSLASPSLREDILEHGLFGCYRYQQLLD